jgi:hypothetical protein
MNLMVSNGCVSRTPGFWTAFLVLWVPLWRWLSHEKTMLGHLEQPISLWCCVIFPKVPQKIGKILWDALHQNNIFFSAQCIPHFIPHSKLWVQLAIHTLFLILFLIKQPKNLTHKSAQPSFSHHGYGTFSAGPPRRSGTPWSDGQRAAHGAPSTVP